MPPRHSAVRHPFTDDLSVGDVVWTVHDPAKLGDHLVVVRPGKKAGYVRPTKPAAGGVSHSHGAEYEGSVSIEAGRIVLRTADGTRVDMVKAEKIV